MTLELRRNLITVIEGYITKVNKRAAEYRREILASGTKPEDDIVYQVNRNYVFLSQKWMEAEQVVLKLQMKLGNLPEKAPSKLKTIQSK